jgi:drug/metabolite transporter (DMT)-like permease
MISPTIRKLAAAALAVVGVIHLVLSPEYLSEQTYIGVLFIAGGLFLCALAIALWTRDNVPSWLLGALTMAGMGIGYILSLTTGLPGFKESELELSGIVCLVLEACFVATAIAALSRGGATTRTAPAAAADDDVRFTRSPARERETTGVR